MDLGNSVMWDVAVLPPLADDFTSKSSTEAFPAESASLLWGYKEESISIQPESDPLAQIQPRLSIQPPSQGPRPERTSPRHMLTSSTRSFPRCEAGCNAWGLKGRYFADARGTSFGWITSSNLGRCTVNTSDSKKIFPRPTAYLKRIPALQCRLGSRGWNLHDKMSAMYGFNTNFYQKIQETKASK